MVPCISFSAHHFFALMYFSFFSPFFNTLIVKMSGFPIFPFFHWNPSRVVERCCVLILFSFFFIYNTGGNKWMEWLCLPWSTIAAGPWEPLTRNVIIHLYLVLLQISRTAPSAGYDVNTLVVIDDSQSQVATEMRRIRRKCQLNIINKCRGCTS